MSEMVIFWSDMFAAQPKNPCFNKILKGLCISLFGYIRLRRTFVQQYPIKIKFHLTHKQ
jgi:hypothetical protein